MDPGTVVVLIVAAFGGYWLSVRLWPYKRCPRCGGGGRNAGSNSRRFGMCGRCGGSGRRERFGVRLFFHRR